MKMTLCWMSLMLLSCSFSSVALSHSTCSCNVSIEVQCPNMTKKEMTFDLFRDGDIISQVKCVREKNATMKCERQPQRAGVDLREDRHHNSVSFLVTKSRCGLYQCEGTVVFPPPMLKVPSVLRIKVLEGLPCTCSEDGGNPGDDPNQRLVWIWIVVVAFLSIYGVTVTAIAVVYWVKLRNTDAHSDYINTKPRVSRERRKKKGVQKPIPRHF
ncbi:T-cell-specific surface glycoprotein CD28 [Solea solea]|uniref:T-cell-specific surface glycoprotein CD28 n=1 Tax=Solea solea TaxID=90069 RepID=UPI00272CD8E3|nr:T-cell-specific surface glycoprotein CD28 [Solea solea]